MAQYDNCTNCFMPIGGASVCPYCGFDHEKARKYSGVLPPFTVLRDRYLMGRVLGKGGFGITYLARDFARPDNDPKKIVAIKEYMPSEFSSRGNDTLSISPYADEKSRFVFRHGKEKFVEEARTLAQLKNDPIVVDILDYFEENNTAYLVMEFLDGSDLKNRAKITGGTLDPEFAKNVFVTVASSLIEVHNKGILHRDLSPDNIVVTNDGRIKLIDFGAARSFVSTQNKGMSILLKPGYAPPEQYEKKGDHGPWCDVYALCATFYHLVSGKPLVDALFRARGEKQPSLKELGVAVSQRTSDVIEKGMALDYKQRYKDFMELLNDIDMPAAKPRPTPPPPPPAPVPPVQQPPVQQPPVQQPPAPPTPPQNPAAQMAQPSVSQTPPQPPVAQTPPQAPVQPPAAQPPEASAPQQEKQNSGGFFKRLFRGNKNAPTPGPTPGLKQPQAPAQPGYQQPAAPAQPSYQQPQAPAQPSYQQSQAPAQPSYQQPQAPAQPSYQQPVSQMRQPQSGYQQPVSQMRQPQSGYQQPVSQMRQPQSGYQQQVSQQQPPQSGYQQPVSQMRQPQSGYQQQVSQQQPPQSGYQQPVSQQRPPQTGYQQQAAAKPRPYVAAIVGNSLQNKMQLGLREPVRIGRSDQSCQYVISGDTNISRVHCCVSYDGAKIRLMDSSSNGTYFANGIRLNKGQEYEVPPGTIFYLATGNHLFIVDY